MTRSQQIYFNPLSPLVGLLGAVVGTFIACSPLLAEVVNTRARAEHWFRQCCLQTAASCVADARAPGSGSACNNLTYNRELPNL